MNACSDAQTRPDLKTPSGLLPNQEGLAGAQNQEILPEDPFLQKVRQLVESNIMEEIHVEDLPKSLYYSKAQVFRKIKALTGQSPSRYICRIRLEKAMELLINSSRKISDIALEVGFVDDKYFFRVFRREFGMSPSAIRQKTLNNK